MFHLKYLLVTILLGSTVCGAEESWEPLFNCKDLAGWVTYLSKPDAAWEVAGLKRDEKGNYLEPVGTNRDPLKVFTVETVDGSPAIHGHS